MVKAGKGFRAAKISFIAKVLVAMGAKRMKKLNDVIYGGYEVDLGHHAKLTKMKIAITRSRTGGCAARARLRRRLLGPPPPVFALNLLWPTELPKRARGCRCSGGVARRNGGGAGGGAGKYTTPRSVSERAAPSTRASPTRRRV